MVTRDIKKNTATQVNANLIGVQVRPEVVPPTYEVNELTANVRIDKFECGTTSNGLPMLCVLDNDYTIWAYTGSQEEFGGTVYNEWSCVMGTGPGYNLYTDTNDTITDQTQFYIHPDAPDAPPVLRGPESEYMLSYEGSLYRFDPNGDYYVIDSEYANTYLDGVADCSLVDGFFISSTDGRYLGKYISDSVYIEEGMNFIFYGEGIESATWESDYYYFKVYLYSTVRNPAVGDNLISNDQGTDAYTSQVIEVYEDEVDPGYTEDVDCSVSYSVDGETWTDWPENMTDDNNVISNIPRYMYLKFSQDVVITEE